MNKKSNNTPYNFDYSRIKDKVSENLRAPAPQQSECDAVPQQPKRKPLWKRVCIMVTCAVLLIALGCVGTLGVQKAFAETEITPSFRNAQKSTYLIDKYFDNFVAFGGGFPDFCPLNEILSSKLISEEDKSALAMYSERVNASKYNVYLGEKNGKDIVLMHAVGVKTVISREEDVDVWIFDSNLEYSLASIVQAFEKLSGEALSQEFLGQIYQSPDNHYLDGNGGIIMRLRMQYSNQEILSLDGTLGPNHDFGETYFTEINGQIYGVTREMLLENNNN